MKLLISAVLILGSICQLLAQTPMPSFTDLEKHQLLREQDRLLYEQWSKSDAIKALQKKPAVFELIKPLHILQFIYSRAIQQENEEQNGYEETPKIKPQKTSKKKTRNDNLTTLDNLLKIKLIDNIMYQALSIKLKNDENLNYKPSLIQTAINLHIESKQNQKIIQNYLAEYLYKRQVIDSLHFSSLLKNIAQSNEIRLENYYKAMNPITYTNLNIDLPEIDSTIKVYAKKIPNIDISKLNFKLVTRKNSSSYDEQVVITQYGTIRFETLIYNESGFNFNDMIIVLNDLLAHLASSYRFIQCYSNIQIKGDVAYYAFFLKEDFIRDFNQAYYEYRILSPFYFSDYDYQNYLQPDEIRQKLEDCRLVGLFNHLPNQKISQQFAEATQKSTKYFANILADFLGVFFNLEKAKPFETILKRLAAQAPQKLQISNIVDESKMIDSVGTLDYSQTFTVSFQLNDKVYKLDQTEIYDYYNSFMDLLERAFEENNLEIRFYEIVDTDMGGSIILLSAEQARILREKKVLRLRLL